MSDAASSPAARRITARLASAKVRRGLVIVIKSPGAASHESVISPLSYVGNRRVNVPDGGVRRSAGITATSDAPPAAGSVTTSPRKRIVTVPVRGVRAYPIAIVRVSTGIVSEPALVPVYRMPGPC